MRHSPLFPSAKKEEIQYGQHQPAPEKDRLTLKKTSLYMQNKIS
jgi:hypothetical protein